MLSLERVTQLAAVPTRGDVIAIALLLTQAISDLEAEFAQFCTQAAYSPPTQVPSRGPALCV